MPRVVRRVMRNLREPDGEQQEEPEESGNQRR